MAGWESEWSSYLYHDMKGALAKEEERDFTVSSTQALWWEQEQSQNHLSMRMTKRNTDVVSVIDSHMPQWETDMETHTHIHLAI